MRALIRRLLHLFNFASVRHGHDGTTPVAQLPRKVSIPDLPRRTRIRQHDEIEGEYDEQWKAMR